MFEWGDNQIGVFVDKLPAKLLRLSSQAARSLVVLVSLGITVALYVLFLPNFSLLEERLGNLGWTVSSGSQLEERIVIVAIDERSISTVGPWPWPREKMAQLVTAIDAAGAQLQLHDIAYTDSKQGDDQLRAAFAASRGAVISQIPILSENSAGPQTLEDIRAGVMTHALTGVSCNESGISNFSFPSSESYIAASAGFVSVPKGHITPLVNADGSISKQPAIVCVDGLPYPALAVAALQQASLVGDQDKPEMFAKVDQGGGLLGPAQRLTLDAYPGLAIPLDRKGNLRVSYANHPASYQAVSAVDVLNGSADWSLLKGSWVLVGATAFGLDDVIPTPYSGAAPGVELQARILGSILDVNVPYTPQAAGWFLGLLCVCFAALLVRVADMDNKAAVILLPMMMVLLPLTSLAIHAQLLHSISVWLGWIFPALFGSTAAILILLFEQARVRRQRNRVLGNLESYLPSDMAQQIAYSLPSSDIEADRRDVTLLSADLRNFSAYSESRPAEESAAVLHFFFQRATQIVEKLNGRIHEFTGDGLLAIWDEQGAESAELAYRAGSQMVEEINYRLLDNYAPEGLEALVVGVGIEQGPALIGSIGPAHRRAHALLGDTVTIALRVQEMTADLAQPILLGECVARQLQSTRLQSQGSYLLTGLKNPHTLYAPAPPHSRSLDDRSAPKLTVLSGGRR